MTVKILKLNIDFVSTFIIKIFNGNIDQGNSHDDLKLADISPVYIKNSRNEKTNYRPAILCQH